MNDYIVDVFLLWIQSNTTNTSFPFQHYSFYFKNVQLDTAAVLSVKQQTEGNTVSQ